MNNKIKVRNPALDIIRCFAFLFVVCVHFFMNTEFYYEKVSGFPMYVMMVMRSLFIICVPLYLLLTGYLMSGKKLTLSYYGKISKQVLSISPVFIIFALENDLISVLVRI